MHDCCTFLFFQFKQFQNVMKILIVEGMKIFAIWDHVSMHVGLQSVVLMPNVLLDSILTNVYALITTLGIQKQNAIHVGVR